MYILAIDQGTTGTTIVVYDKKGRIVNKQYQEFRQIYPKPGWVEHDPEEIWQTVVHSISRIPKTILTEVYALGITNQRETTILWNKTTGKPVYNAIVWQCRRTADYCQKIKDHESFFRQKTGLPIDAYFSATKIRWILNEILDYKQKNILFGTIDSWLIWKLTAGNIHATDHTNASRTLIYNIKEKKWDDELCKFFGIKAAILPEVKNSMDDYGTVLTIPALKGIPICGVAGDQQAALFGQACFQKGEIKNTYGTGGFAMINTGNKFIQSRNGLITTLAVDEQCLPCYALEGSVFIAGAAIQWLRDELKLITKASESEAIALSLQDNGGVYMVPAFVGLGAPHWNMEARGTITGLTRGANRNYLIRAALEAMAYQTYDVIKVMETDANLKIEKLSVDGGAAVNNFLMQFQADLLSIPILRPEIIESTSQGAAFLAGLKTGFWKNTDELIKLKRIERTFQPKMDNKIRQNLLLGWKKAVKQTLTE